MDADVIDLTIRQHEDIYTALAAGDATLAQAVATVHVSTTQSWFRRVLAAEEAAEEDAVDEASLR
jgi:GntR family transcriptional repressor for pyruvate dehydrogenase complex